MENTTDHKKVKLNLVGLNGNIFSLMAEFTKAARRQGWTKEETEEVTNKCMNAEDYDRALAVLINHTESED